MFVLKTEAELTAMTPEQRDAYAVEKQKHDAEQVSKKVAEEVEKATKEMKEVISKNEAEIIALKEVPSVKTPVTLSTELKESKETISKLAKNGGAEVVVKALSNRASITNNQQAFDLPDLGQLATRQLTAYDVFPKLTIGGSNDNGTVRYYDWDKDTTVRAADMIAEGAAFPESTAKFQKYSLDLKKVGDTLPVSDEFFEDEQMFASELEMFLKTNVEVKIDDQIVNGTGSGQQLTGLLTTIDAFDATTYAGTIDTPTIYDLLVKVREDITKTGGSKYRPDIAMMNISMINKYRLEKDANKNYIIPPFVSADGKIIDGLTVIECNAVADDVLIVGDRRFGRIYEKGGLVVAKGEVNTQFTEDEMTLKVRKRLLFLIRNADKGGFRKVTSIAADLTELAIV